MNVYSRIIPLANPLGSIDPNSSAKRDVPWGDCVVIPRVPPHKEVFLRWGQWT